MFKKKPTYEELEQRVGELEKADAGNEQTEHVLNFLAQSSMAPNADFFQTMAQYLSENLDMDYACISRLAEDQLSAQTLALYVDGKFEDNISYTLHDTPCGKVVEKTVYCVPENVRNVFPHNEVLQHMVAESYVGTQLVSRTGKPIGLITLVGRRPLANPQPIEYLLKTDGDPRGL